MWRTERIHHDFANPGDGLVAFDLRHAKTLVAGTGVGLKVDHHGHGFFLFFLTRVRSSRQTSIAMQTLALILL